MSRVTYLFAQLLGSVRYFFVELSQIPVFMRGVGQIIASYALLAAKEFCVSGLQSWLASCRGKKKKKEEEEKNKHTLLLLLPLLLMLLLLVLVLVLLLLILLLLLLLLLPTMMV